MEDALRKDESGHPLPEVAEKIQRCLRSTQGGRVFWILGNKG